MAEYSIVFTLVIVFAFLYNFCFVTCQVNDSHVKNDNTNGTVTIQRELYDILTDLLQRELNGHQIEQQNLKVAGLEQRTLTLETKLNIFQEERSQLYKYADVMTEVLKRLMKLEYDTDSTKNTMEDVMNFINKSRDETERIDIRFAEIEHAIGRMNGSDSGHHLNHTLPIRPKKYGGQQNESNRNSEKTTDLSYHDHGDISEIEKCEMLVSSKIDAVEREVLNIIQYVNHTDQSVARLQNKLVILTNKFRIPTDTALPDGSDTLHPTTPVISSTQVSSIQGGGHIGTDFWFTFPQNRYTDSNTYLFIYIGSNLNNQSRVHIEDEAGNTTHTFSKSLVVKKNRSLQLLPNVIEHKGVRVISNHTVSVNVYSTYHFYQSGSFNIVPATSLGLSYITISYHPPSTHYSYVAILAIHPDTTVRITLNTTNSYTHNGQSYDSGESFEIYLKQFDTFQLSHTADLTGTKLDSTRDIAAQSGCTIANYPGYSNSYYAVFLPAIQYLGSLFILPTFVSANKTSIRVVPLDTSTSITIYEHNSTSNYRLTKTLEIDISLTHPSVISCTKPCLVAAYYYSKAPLCQFMTLIPAITQYSSQYTYETPHDELRNYTHYMAVVVKSSQVAGLMINNKTIFAFTLNSETLMVRRESWTILTMEIVQGNYDIISNLGESYYGVIAYGLRDNSAYAYPLGLNLN